MKIHHYYILTLFAAALISIPSLAQSDNTLREVYAEAETNYQIGRLDKTIESLKGNIAQFSGTRQQGAYRLLALSCLGLDREAEAEQYASMLLKLNPYYTTTMQDPMRFVDMIERLKKGQTATITTASSQAESLEEVPVPVTLITDEMIERSGVRNIKEALLLFVPGMSNVESNEETNISMRGIYSSGQEKILFMLNGHRLNSYGTNVARPDFSMSLQKVKQIEVLRGPASSLYGGVALTAVVNIITKDGNNIDGLEATAAIGNYGQLRGGLLFGKHYLDLDVTAWANIYKADGEKMYLNSDEVLGTSPIPGDVIIGGFNHKPTHDFGALVKWKNFSVLYNSSFSKTVAPYSLSYFFSPYSYDKYRTVDGSLPGFASRTNNVELAYTTNIGNVNLHASVNYDHGEHQLYQAITDLMPAELHYFLIPSGTNDSIFLKDGAFQCLSFSESNIGAQLRVGVPYSFANDHQGYITFGAHMNRFSLLDAENYEGGDYSYIYQFFGEEKNLRVGSENSADAYLQLKHKWKNFIVNAGLRYDYKKRLGGKVFNEFSPRVALIYMNPAFNLKLSYSRAFVDAPYFYRYNTLDTYMGGENLGSEYLDSWQFTVGTNRILPGLEAEMNVFYNSASNLISRDGLIYANSGLMDNVGVELSATYRRKRLFANGNFIWQRLLDSESYRSSSNRIYNIPACTANLMAGFDLTSHLSLSATMRLEGSQMSTFESPSEDMTPIYTEEELKARVVTGLGITYRIYGLKTSLRAYNLLNTKYDQGGTSIGPIRQQGRWMMLDVSYKF